MIDAITRLDGEVLLFVQEHIRTPALDWLMKFFSFIGDGGAVWIAVAVLLLLFPRTRRGGLDVALCLALASLVNNLLIKQLVARDRPYWVMQELAILVEPLSSYSFPSGHTCSSFAAAFAICAAFRDKGGAWAYLPASLIALSRIYVGVHYPSDVLAGILTATLISWGVYTLSRKYIKSDLMSQRERQRLGL